jgi:hypothetical protein
LLLPHSLLQLVLEIRVDPRHLSWWDSLVLDRKIKLFLLKNNCVLLSNTVSNPAVELSHFAGNRNSKEDCEVDGVGL